MDYQRMVEKAKMFELFVRTFKELPDDLLAPIGYEQIDDEINARSFVQKPFVQLVNDRLYCDEEFIDLSASQLILQLFRLFITSAGKEVSRQEVAEKIYGAQWENAMSERYRSCCLQNAVKLVSRAREMTQKFQKDDIEWFVYNQSKKSWTLFSVQTGQLALT